jgi:hypothetical protein
VLDSERDPGTTLPAFAESRGPPPLGKIVPPSVRWVRHDIWLSPATLNASLPRSKAAVTCSSRRTAGSGRRDSSRAPAAPAGAGAGIGVVIASLSSGSFQR